MNTKILSALGIGMIVMLFLVSCKDEPSSSSKLTFKGVNLNNAKALALVQEGNGSANEKAMQMGCVDAGIVCENINLYCQAVGLVTVPRATHDTEGLRKLLGLTDKQLPIMNNPVGYPKK